MALQSIESLYLQTDKSSLPIDLGFDSRLCLGIFSSVMYGLGVCVYQFPLSTCCHVLSWEEVPAFCWSVGESSPVCTGSCMWAIQTPMPDRTISVLKVKLYNTNICRQTKLFLVQTFLNKLETMCKHFCFPWNLITYFWRRLNLYSGPSRPSFLSIKWSLFKNISLLTGSSLSKEY